MVFRPGNTVIWHNRREKAEVVPFSFMACCAIAGYDADVLKDFVYSKLPQSQKDIIKARKAA